MDKKAIEVKLELDELLEKKRMTPSDRRLLVLLLEKLFSLLGWVDQPEFGAGAPKEIPGDASEGGVKKGR